MFNFDIFFSKLLKGEIYFDNFPKGRTIRFKKKTLPLLIKSIKDKDEHLLSSTLSVLFYDGADSDYTELLLSLLKQDWHFLEEDIVEILEIISDPKSINDLFDLIVNIPDYDEMRSLAKKCMYTLSSINTQESIDKLKLLQESKDPIIQENAIFHINNLNA